MKYLFIGLASVILMSVCLSTSVAQQEGYRDEVIKYVDEVWNKGNLAYIDQLMDANVSRFGHAAEGNTEGIAAYKERVKQIRSEFTDYNVKLLDMTGVGNKATFSWQLRGNYVGADKKISPGRAVDIMGKTVWMFRGNKVVREIVEMDEQEYFRQIKMAAPYSQVGNRALMLSYLYEVIAAGDVSAVDELVADSHVLHATNGKDLKGKEALRAHVEKMRAAFPDMTVKIQEVVSEGNSVFARWTLSGTWRGEWNGMSPTNRPIAASGLSMMSIKDDKVQETWSILDVLAVELAAKR